MKKIEKFLSKKEIKKNLLNILLILVVIAIYFEINVFVQKFKISDIDLSKSQIYSLSQESKDKVKNIDKKITIQLINFENYQYVIDFANKYSKENANITIERIDDISNRSDLKTSYNLEDTDSLIVVKCGDREKTLTMSDLSTYEYSSSSYEEVNITEEAITNAIVDLTTANKPQIYFYIAHSAYPKKYFTTIEKSIQNDASEVNYLDLLSSGKVPENCNCLVIPTLIEDISSVEKEYIVNYINNGGKILLLEDANVLNKNLPNYQSILDLYGISVSSGVLMEQSADKMVYNKPGFIITETSQNTSLTQKLNMKLNMCLIDAGKINFKSQEELKNLNVEYETIASASETAFLRNNLSITDTKKVSNDEDASGAIVGAIIKKKINDTTTSKIIVFSDGIFATNTSININNNPVSAVSFYNNEDMVVNSINYLAERENSITIRKKYGDNVKFTVTELQNKNIIKIIYGLPMIIIFIGYVVWRMRKNKR